MKTIKNLLPGILFASILGSGSIFVADNLPVGFISASILALSSGILIRSIFGEKQILNPGIRFVAGKFLKFAIILLGVGLNITAIYGVAKVYIFIFPITIFITFGIGYFVKKYLKLNSKTSSLISVGASICGGSAIAAISPIIDADEKDIAYSISTIFLFDMLMIILFPVIGNIFNFSDIVFGYWTGSAVNDTSSVVATAYSYGTVSGDFAVALKLIRTMTIIPAIAIFSIIKMKKDYSKTKLIARRASSVLIDRIINSLPWFAIGFFIMVLLNSVSIIPESAVNIIKSIGKYFMVSSLAAIGFNINIKDLKFGFGGPLVYGFILSALVATVTAFTINILSKVNIIG